MISHFICIFFLIPQPPTQNTICIVILQPGARSLTIPPVEIKLLGLITLNDKLSPFSLPPRTHHRQLLIEFHPWKKRSGAVARRRTPTLMAADFQFGRVIPGPITRNDLSRRNFA